MTQLWSIGAGSTALPAWGRDDPGSTLLDGLECALRAVACRTARALVASRRNGLDDAQGPFVILLHGGRLSHLAVEAGPLRAVGVHSARDLLAARQALASFGRNRRCFVVVAALSGGQPVFGARVPPKKTQGPADRTKLPATRR